MVWLRGIEGLEMGAPWGGGRPAWAHSPPFTSSLPPPHPHPPPHWPGSQNYQRDRNETKGSWAGRRIFSRCECLWFGSSWPELQPLHPNPG